MGPGLLGKTFLAIFSSSTKSSPSTARPGQCLDEGKWTPLWSCPPHTCSALSLVLKHLLTSAALLLASASSYPLSVPASSPFGQAHNSSKAQSLAWPTGGPRPALCRPSFPCCLPLPLFTWSVHITAHSLPGTLMGVGLNGVRDRCGSHSQCVTA